MPSTAPRAPSRASTAPAYQAPDGAGAAQQNRAISDEMLNRAYELVGMSRPGAPRPEAPRGAGPRPPAAGPRPPSGGGGGGGGGNPRPGIKGPAEFDISGNSDVDKMIRDNAMDLASGKTSRYNDQRVNMMKDQLFESTVGRVKGEVKRMDADLTRRGLFRSGLAARSANDLRREGLKQFGQGVREILMKKMDAEFEDKMQGLNLANSYLQNRRQYELGLEQNKIAREQIAAQLSIAAMQNATAREGIAAQRASAAASLGWQKDSFAISLAASGRIAPGGGFTANFNYM